MEPGLERPGEAMHPHWNIRGAEALDQNVRGRSSPGLERPGLQKEEETAAERSGKENMNKSKELSPRKLHPVFHLKGDICVQKEVAQFPRVST